MISRGFSEEAKVPLILAYVKLTPDTLQVIRCIDSRFGSIGDHGDAYAEAVPEHTQLLERLEFLQRRRRQRAITAQETATISIYPDVALRRQGVR